MYYYAGIGSRECPEAVCGFMTEIAILLNVIGFTLRSGGAAGADQAFEAGSKRKEIFLAGDSTPEAENLASQIHPNWKACKPYVRKLHGRNCFQILGRDLKTPSTFVVCWTPKGEDVGGTRTAIVLAKQHNIPVYNLAIPGEVFKLEAFLFTPKKGIR